MKKINFLKGVALSVSALMVFSLSGCDYISQFIGGNNGGNNNDITGGDNNTTEPQLTISQTELTLGVGKSFPLSASSSDGAPITWSSDNTEIATVDNGVVTGVAEGTTMIFAETAALTQICYVTVTAEQITPPHVEDSLTLSSTNISLKVGDSQTLTATCLVDGAVANVTVKWTATCSPSGCITVTSGKITAVKEGEAVVTASATFPSGTTIKKTCAVKVTKPDDSDKNGYTLVWCDEFNGTSLDTAKWNYQTGTQDIYGSATGPAYWGNGELQYYAEDAVSGSGGSLKITAKKQQRGDRPYTSGRILTRDKSSWTYGYFEAKMKTPTGNGMWPAFWMLPQPSGPNTLENQYGGWPANGEIDIMEAKGRLYNMVDTTLHFRQSVGRSRLRIESNSAYFEYGPVAHLRG